MDPNEALRQLRALAAKVITSVDAYEGLDEADEEELEEMALAGESLASQFQALDEWLSKGGFLPADWRGK